MCINCILERNVHDKRLFFKFDEPSARKTKKQKTN